METITAFMCSKCGEMFRDDMGALNCCQKKDTGHSPRRWLQDFMREVNSQDNRATARPYYYELRYQDDDGNEQHVDYGQNVFFTNTAALDYIDSQQHNLPKGVYTFLCWGGRNPELKQLLENIGKVVGIEYERK